MHPECAPGQLWGHLSIDQHRSVLAQRDQALARLDSDRRREPAAPPCAQLRIGWHPERLTQRGGGVRRPERCVCRQRTAAESAARSARRLCRQRQHLLLRPRRTARRRFRGDRQLRQRVQCAAARRSLLRQSVLGRQPATAAGIGAHGRGGAAVVTRIDSCACHAAADDRNGPVGIRLDAGGAHGVSEHFPHPHPGARR